MKMEKKKNCVHDKLCQGIKVHSLWLTWTMDAAYTNTWIKVEPW